MAESKDVTSQNEQYCEAESNEASADSSPWITLTDPKEWSRLLYTNPACFLGTLNNETDAQSATTTDAPKFNVMILSWLTATNNTGSFMFSLNKHRHSATVLGQTYKFTLSVPVQGMEELICQVGGVSGKWGISKFPQDHPSDVAVVEQSTNASTSQSKKRKGPKFPRGIPGLVRVPFGHGKPAKMEGSSPDTNISTWPFFVQGTVAHLLCRVKHMQVNDAWIDQDHYIVFAQVEQAMVSPAYWKASNNLFQPSPGLPPYLTFFGSQTFGYVSSKPLPINDDTFASNS